jgi:hypothetical protein
MLEGERLLSPAMSVYSCWKLFHSCSMLIFISYVTYVKPQRAIYQTLFWTLNLQLPSDRKQTGNNSRIFRTETWQAVTFLGVDWQRDFTTSKRLCFCADGDLFVTYGYSVSLNSRKRFENESVWNTQPIKNILLKYCLHIRAGIAQSV